MNRTGIDYVDYTWNWMTGCEKPFCPYCYNLTKPGMPLTTWLKSNRQKETGGIHIANPGEVYPYGYDLTFYPHRLDEPLRVKKPSRIFSVDCGDWAADGVPPEWQAQALDVMRCADWHTFLLLTKRPQNLAKWSPYPPNCWVGVSVVADGPMTLAVTRLAGIQASVKFLSIEPLLGSITMKSHSLENINGIIIGAQTGPGAVVPRLEWVHEIMQAANKARIPLFLKNNLLRQFPNDLPWRQEVPQ